MDFWGADRPGLVFDQNVGTPSCQPIFGEELLFLHCYYCARKVLLGIGDGFDLDICLTICLQRNFVSNLGRLCFAHLDQTPLTIPFRR